MDTTTSALGAAAFVVGLWLGGCPVRRQSLQLATASAVLSQSVQRPLVDWTGAGYRNSGFAE